MTKPSAAHTYDFRLSEREAHIRQKTAGSIARLERSQKSLSGGVSSGLRRTARPFPLYFSHGKGSTIQDVDGNSYLDYMLGWGPLILGHSPDPVNEAIADCLQRGYTFGAQHDLEYEVAELMQRFIPCAEQVVFANSGTEIVQVALRLARAIHIRFGLPAEPASDLLALIKRADHLSAYHEATQLAGFSRREAAKFFGSPPKGLATPRLVPLPADQAQAQFLERFQRLA